MHVRLVSAFAQYLHFVLKVSLIYGFVNNTKRLGVIIQSFSLCLGATIVTIESTSNQISFELHATVNPTEHFICRAMIASGANSWKIAERVFVSNHNHSSDFSCKCAQIWVVYGTKHRRENIQIDFNYDRTWSWLHRCRNRLHNCSSRGISFDKNRKIFIMNKM